MTPGPPATAEPRVSRPMRLNDQTSSPLPRQALEAAAEICRCWDERPAAGLILGTGLHSLTEHIDTDLSLDYEDIPHFPCSTALSHRGQLVCGRLADVPVLVMDGRCHLYEGYSLAEITRPVCAMFALGIDLLIVSNASGGLNPKYASGDVMVIRDHIDLMFAGPMCSSPCSSPLDRPTSARTFYDEVLIQRALVVARHNNFAAHAGVYAAMSGPNYETRAEYRYLRRIGADAVGMSTVPEAVAARQCGMNVLALSTITNVAQPDIAEQVDPEEVIDAAERAEPNVRKIAMDAVATAG